MSLIGAADQERLRQDFAVMTRNVRLLFFTQTFGCDTCVQTRQILDELPPLSPRIIVEDVNLVLDRERAAQYGVDRAPSVAVAVEDEAGEVRDTRIRFVGVPAGYEFLALVNAVLLAGGRPSQLSEANLARLAALDRPMTIRVFSTPTCPHCPRAITMAHEMAFASSQVTAFAVEVTEFPDLARQYHVTGVPKTVVDDGVEILGALPEDDFIAQALSPGADAPTAP